MKPKNQQFMLSLLAFFCLAIGVAQETNYSITQIPEELLENADAIVRMDEIDIEIKSISSMEITERKAITIRNKSGERQLRLADGYDKETKIKSIGAVVYNAFGKEIKRIKRKDFNDYAAVDGFSLYVDNRVLHHRYIPVAYPYTVEFTTVKQTSDTGAIPQWYFLGGYSQSVEKSSYKVSYPSEDFKPVFKEKNLDEYEVVKKEVEGQVTYTAKGLKAIKYEEMCPNFKKLTPKLMVRLPKFSYKGYKAEIADWNDMGEWIETRLLEGRQELPETTIQEVKNLVAGSETNLEKAKRVYEYVQDNTRYVSVQIGIGGFQPISAVEVDQVKYGDCKGLSNYTKALLEAVGVDAYYVHVDAGAEKVDFEEDFADLIQGNHAILAIPYQGQYYWIDCTSQVHPFGFVGDFTDDRQVLVVTPKGGEIVKTVGYTNEDNYQKMLSEYTVDAKGNIKGDISILTKGIQYDNRFHMESRSKEECEKYYKNSWSYINGIEIEKASFKNDKDKIEFTEDIKVSASNYLVANGDEYLLPINTFNRYSNVPSRYKNRILPFEVKRGFLDEDKFIINLPTSLELGSMPEAVSIENKYGVYKTQLSKNAEGKLEYSRSLLLKKGYYSNEEFKDFRKFMRSIAKYDNQKIVLKMKNQ